MFLNGIGKINIQLLIGVLMAIVNIPLSVWISRSLGIGPAGIIIATLICNVITLIVLVTQVRKLCSNDATGVWNK